MSESTSSFPDAQVEAPYEAGLPLPEAKRAESLPPGGGGLALPHFLTFSQLVNLASRTYRWTFDEALRHSQANALAIRRDPVVYDALRTRQIPTAQLPWHIECDNDQDQRQTEAAGRLTKAIDRIPRFQTMKMQLLEALFYGRYGVQMALSWEYRDGRKDLVVRDHRPLNGDKLVFKYSGQPGILVHATFPGTWQVSDRGRVHFFTPEEREQILIHRHEPEDSDFFEPELAGAVQGTGLRSRLYWLWYLRSQIMSFLMDFLERVGAGGFTIYYYEMGNDESLAEVKQAAEEQHRNNTILFPRYRDGSTGGPGIDRVEPSQAGAQLLSTLVTGYFDQIIRRTILGADPTTEGRGTSALGGSGVADLRADEFVRRIKYDAVNLQETLTTDLVAVLQRYMYPDLPPGCLRFVFDVDKPNSAEVLEAATSFYEMGGTIDEDELRGVLGLTKPAPGHSMLAKMANLSPQTAGVMPEGVPLVGAPGPAPGEPGPEMGGMPPEAAGMPPGAPQGPPGPM